LQIIKTKFVEDALCSDFKDSVCSAKIIYIVVMLSKTKTPAKPLIQLRKLALQAPVVQIKVNLADGKQTTAYIVRHRREVMRPRVIVFEEYTPLLEWCLENDISDAMVGGYDYWHTDTLLGEAWTNGQRHLSRPITSPWHKVRGTIHIDAEGDITLAPRNELPQIPSNDLLQAGPLLVRDGLSLIVDGLSPEGFSQTSEQFDPDPTVGRHPRSAIGYNDQYMWTVVTDGRVEGEAGLNLAELAELMLQLGASRALNLDGGTSTQLVRRGRVMNKPWGSFGDHYPEGYPIRSAIIFEKH
jgi:hypothetical protein